MCLLAASFQKIKNEEALENGFCSNSHGAGFAYSFEKKLYMEKGFFTFQEFMDAYNLIPDDAPNIVHFRLATGGKTNEENCHPFLVNKNLAFAHNGIFSCVDSNHEHSDTYEFNRLLMQPLFGKHPHLVFTDAAKFLIEKTIGGYNKVAFINNFGKITICNEDNGDWDEGIWWSNGSWKSYRSFYKGNDRGFFSGSNYNRIIKPPTTAPTLVTPVFDDWLKQCYLDFLKENPKTTTALSVAEINS